MAQHAIPATEVQLSIWMLGHRQKCRWPGVESAYVSITVWAVAVKGAFNAHIGSFRRLCLDSCAGERCMSMPFFARLLKTFSASSLGAQAGCESFACGAWSERRRSNARGAASSSVMRVACPSMNAPAIGGIEIAAATASRRSGVRMSRAEKRRPSSKQTTFV